MRTATIVRPTHGLDYVSDQEQKMRTYRPFTQKRHGIPTVFPVESFDKMVMAYLKPANK